ncbi:unnamed protein product [Thlaspi arvense]|uniref:Aromatic amino acid beta-eliminating lyase/threonine aldolase domain-containing protein n=1 Tax=Thlaspi arvense TaxID=13288 RepID=A0AAU9T7M7_THLAR|nr:unnamed protein product [Thlaspi arvense]
MNNVSGDRIDDGLSTAVAVPASTTVQNRLPLIVPSASTPMGSTIFSTLVTLDLSNRLRNRKEFLCGNHIFFLSDSLSLFHIKMVTPTTRMVDLRSDTVTKPTESIRSAMANAKGRRFGERSNCRALGERGLGGVHPRTVKNEEDETMEIGSLEAAVRSPKGDLHYPLTKLICLENTQANCGGRCLPIEYIDKVGELAKKHGLKLHIDGARIFNASTALQVPMKRIVRAADSVSARWLRKTLGGGMSQIGVLCGAALVALHENVAKLDHKKAKILTEGLNQIERLRTLR